MATPVSLLPAQAERALRDERRRKDEFLANLSHELRNPLTPLRVALDIARMCARDPTQLAEAHAIMDRQVARLSQLVDELLDLSRFTRGKIVLDRTPIAATTIAARALANTRSLIQERAHELRVELPEAPVHVLGDSARLVQLLTNLLTNAAKYTPPGGHLELVLATDASRELLLVTVRDDGAGIPTMLLPRIFEIFGQPTDAIARTQGGLGVGLHIVRHIAELHGGRVYARSEGLGHGSEFFVELPLASSGSEPR